jgi:hypothetical protein
MNQRQERRHEGPHSDTGQSSSVPDQTLDIQAAQQKLDQLHEQQERFALAASLLSEKQIISTTREKSQQFVEHIRQTGGQ